MIKSSQYGLSEKQTLGLTENDYFEQLQQKCCNDGIRSVWSMCIVQLIFYTWQYGRGELYLYKTEASIIYKGAKII